MSTDDIAIRVANLSKCFQIYDAPRDRLKQFVLPRLKGLAGQTPCQYFREFWALRDVSFEIKKGETVGIIGRNGSGKSTLLQMICGTLTPTGGSVETRGRIAALLELGSGFNPEFTGRENVYMNAAVLGLSNEEVDNRFDDIVSFADIGQFIEQPIKTYSSGMVVRLAFAVAINVTPEILIVDEALSVGDAAFQRKCFRRIENLLSDGTSLLFVSHDIESVRRLCNTALFMKYGCIVMTGPTKEVCDTYEKDLFGNTFCSSAAISEVGGEPSELISFDDQLAIPPEVAYGDGRAEIVDRWVEDSARRRVNVLYRNQPFSWCYRIRFNETIEDFIVAMRIKTVDGVGVFGSHKRYIVKMKAGTHIEVKISLKNHLAPETYFLNCAVLDAMDKQSFMHRRVDTYAIKVYDDIPGALEGFVDLEPIFEWSLY